MRAHTDGPSRHGRAHGFDPRLPSGAPRNLIPDQETSVRLDPKSRSSADRHLISGPKIRSCEMRLKHGLAMVVVSILSLGIGFPSAHALSSWDCAGWTVKLTNTCDNVLAYFHVCYGWNGEFGTDNFNVPPKGGHQIHVQQYSTFISSLTTAAGSRHCRRPPQGGDQAPLTFYWPGHAAVSKQEDAAKI